VRHDSDELEELIDIRYDMLYQLQKTYIRSQQHIPLIKTQKAAELPSNFYKKLDISKEWTTFNINSFE
jgi:hypothetical protein